MNKMELTEKQKQIYSGKLCPYCNLETSFMDSYIVYGKSYGNIYFCHKCNAFVGVHKGTRKALGRLANSKLRTAKKEAHSYFDLIWKHKLMTRKEAYSWLSEALSIPEEYTHIGMFSIETCEKVCVLSQELFKEFQFNFK